MLVPDLLYVLLSQVLHPLGHLNEILSLEVTAFNIFYIYFLVTAFLKLDIFLFYISVPVQGFSINSFILSFLSLPLFSLIFIFYYFSNIFSCTGSKLTKYPFGFQFQNFLKGFEVRNIYVIIMQSGVLKKIKQYDMFTMAREGF